MQPLFDVFLGRNFQLILRTHINSNFFYMKFVNVKNIYHYPLRQIRKNSKVDVTFHPSEIHQISTRN